MIRWFVKYGFVIFLFNTIFYSISLTKDTIAPIVFYITMATGLFFLLLNPKHLKEVLFHKAFLFLMILNLINLTYYLFFDSISNIDSLEYLMARFMSFSLISLSIYYNFSFFKNRFTSMIVKIISLVVFLSLIIDPNLLNGRYHGIIWNPNMLASLTVLAFSCILLKTKEKSPFEKLLLILLLIVSLSTGSRSAIIAIGLSFIFKYGFSLRNVLYSLTGVMLIFMISNTNLETSLNRITSQGIMKGRVEQFNFAIYNIKEKIFTGHGLSEYSGLPSDIDIPKRLEGIFIAAHNGYLSILIQYGIIFGGLVILIIFTKSFELFSFYIRRNDENLVYVFFIVYTLFAANFESLITGINEFHTILFWFSISYLSYSKFLEDHAD